MPKYNLVNFTNETLEETRKNWESIIDEDAFELEFGTAFTWASQHIQSVEGDSVALRLHNTDSDRTDAIVEIVSSRKGAMNKLLKVIPSPKFWDVNNQRDEIVSLYTEAFFKVITMAGFKPSNKVKIYGRDDEMLSILRSIQNIWNIKGSKVDFEGRFFAITWL